MTDTIRSQSELLAFIPIAGAPFRWSAQDQRDLVVTMFAISGGGGGGGAVASVFGRAGAVAANTGDYTFAQIAATPTTIAGYGITDAYTKVASDARFAPIAVPYGSITGAPTTIAGFGITDFNALGDARWSVLAHTHTYASLTSRPTTIAGFAITDTLTNTVFGRSGTVVAVSGDYGVAQITGAAPLASPTFTGTPAGPTAAPGTNTTQIATTAYADAAVAVEAAARVAADALKANIASPTFTGVPLSTTAAPGTNTTQIATTAFVTAAVVAASSGVASFNTRTGAVVPVSGDYTFAQIGSPPTTIAGYGITDAYTKTASDARFAPIAVPYASVTGVPAFALLAGPTFTGVPAAPTAVGGTNTTQIATTAFVASAIGGLTTGVASVFGRAGIVVANANDYTYAQLASKPTTIAGFGITDTLTNTVFGRSGAVVATSGDYTFAQIGSTPTTIGGYGITDAYTKTTADARYAPIAVPYASITGVPAFALLAGPTFTGVPLSTTAAPGTNTTQIATTAFVAAAIGGLTTGVASVFGRAGIVVAVSGDYGVAQITGAAPIASPTFTGVPLSTTPTAGDSSTKIATTAFVATSFAPIASPTFTGTAAATTAAAFTNTTQIATTAFVTGMIDAQPVFSAGTGGSATLTRTAARATQKYIINANATLTIDQTAIPSGAYFIIDTYQNATGGFTRAFALASGSIAWVNGGAPSIPTTPNDGDRVVLYNNGTTIQGWQAWTTTGSTTGITSVFGRTGAVVAASGDYTFAQIASTPTTIGGYGITDAYTKALTDTRVAPAFVALTDGATVTWATAGAPESNASVTIAGNRTLAITGIVSGASGTLFVKQDTTGTRTLTLPAGSIVTGAGGGATPTMSTAANAVDKFTFRYDGTNYWWTVTQYSSPTTIAGYGITDAYTKTASDARFAPIAVPWASITGAPAYALLASPTFTGVPLSTTAVAGTNTTQIATTAFVTAAVAAGGGAVVTLGTLYGSSGTTGCKAASYPRVWADPSFGSTAPTSGQLRVIAMFLPSGLSITSISFFSGTTAAATPLNQWFCLVDSSLNVLAKTADDTSTAWAVSTKKTLTITGGPFVTTYTGLYYVGVLIKATTVPTLEQINGGSGTGSRGMAPIMGGTSTGSLTNPASLGATITAISSSSAIMYAEVA